MSDDINWMDVDAKEEIKKVKNIIAKAKPKRVITVSLIRDEIVKRINPLDTINPDEMRLREILTAKRGAKNKNETYQRNNIINPLIEFLIKQGWIRI